MDDAPFAGRSLHFIGIGGAGMSGLALVARTLGARRDRLGPGRLAGASSGCARRASRPPSGTTRPTCRPAPRWSCRRRSRRTTSSWRPPARRARRVLHRARAAGRAVAHEAHDRRDGRAREDHHRLDGRARAARRRARPGLPDRRRAALRRRRNAAWGAGEWVVIEADESDRSFLKLAPRRRGDHQRRARPPRDLREPRTSSRRRSRSSRDRPSCAWSGRSVALPGEALSDRHRAGRRAARRRPGAASRWLALRGRRARPSTCPCPGAPQRAERARRARRVPRCRRCDLPDAAAALADFSGAGPPLRVARAHARRARSSTTTTPTTRPRCARRSRRPARSPRRSSAAWSPCFQPHLYSRTRALARDFGRALALADVVVVLDVYPARERAEDFPGVSGLLVARGDRRRGRRAPGLVAARAGRWRSACSSPQLGEDDLLVTLGAGDVDRRGEGADAA